MKRDSFQISKIEKKGKPTVVGVVVARDEEESLKKAKRIFGDGKYKAVKGIKP